MTTDVERRVFRVAALAVLTALCIGLWFGAWIGHVLTLGGVWQ